MGGQLTLSSIYLNNSGRKEHIMLVKHPLMATTREQTVVSQNLYGPNGKNVACWIDSLTDRNFVNHFYPLTKLHGWADANREQTLNYVKANNLVMQMNRAVEDATLALTHDWTAAELDIQQDIIDIVVFITEAMVVSNAWEVRKWTNG